MDKLTKKKENPFYKSKYADLSDVLDVSKEHLNDNGICVAQCPNTDPESGYVTVETVLLHESGQWMRGETKLKPSKSDPQGSGSAFTYARRYGLTAMLGLAQEDDDGNAASGKNGTADTSNKSGNQQSGNKKAPTSTKTQSTGSKAPNGVVAFTPDVIMKKAEEMRQFKDERDSKWIAGAYDKFLPVPNQEVLDLIVKEKKDKADQLRLIQEFCHIMSTTNKQPAEIWLQVFSAFRGDDNKVMLVLTFGDLAKKKDGWIKTTYIHARARIVQYFEEWAAEEEKKLSEAV